MGFWLDRDDEGVNAGVNGATYRRFCGRRTCLIVMSECMWCDVWCDTSTLTCERCTRIVWW